MIMNYLEQCLSNKNLVYTLSKRNQSLTSLSNLNSSHRISIKIHPSGHNSNLNRKILQSFTYNSTFEQTKKYKSKKSCFKNPKQIITKKIKISIIKPQIYIFSQNDLNKELLYLKMNIFEYVNYSLEQDNIKPKINLSKLINNELFCQNFFSFKRQKNVINSKHIYLLIDGAYFPKHQNKDSFVDRMMEENDQYQFIEFMWQKFLSNKCHLISPIGNKTNVFKDYSNDNDIGKYFISFKFRKLFKIIP